MRMYRRPTPTRRRISPRPTYDVPHERGPGRRADRGRDYTLPMPPTRPTPANAIRVVGAREHNLRDVSVEIPRDDLVVITGLSGSGKSSLAFDTLYAEGQRRYVESLSAYARQFLGPDGQAGRRPHRGAVAGDLDRPEDDEPQPALDGGDRHRDLRLPAPAVRPGRRAALPDLRAADRRPERGADRRPGAGARRRAPASWCSRPWCATARASTATCSSTSAARASPGSRWTARSTTLDEVPALDKKFNHTIEVVVDRLIMRDDLRRRLSDSLETATGLADGLVRIEEVARRRRHAAVLDLLRAVRLPGARRVAAGARAARPSPSTRPTAPARSAPASASRPRSTRSWSSTPSGRLADGAILPWTDRTTDYYDLLLDVIAEEHDIDLDVPWRDLPGAPAHAAAAGPQAPRADVPGRPAQGRAAGAGSRGSSRSCGASTRPRCPRRCATASSSSCRCARAPPAAGRASSPSRWPSRSRAATSTSSRCCRSPTRWRFFGDAGAERHPGLHRRAGHPGDPRAAALPRRRRRRLPRLWPAPPARSPAARPSASAWPPRSGRAWWGCSTSSTSPRSACTSATTAS